MIQSLLFLGCPVFRPPKMRPKLRKQRPMLERPISSNWAPPKIHQRTNSDRNSGHQRGPFRVLEWGPKGQSLCGPPCIRVCSHARRNKVLNARRNLCFARGNQVVMWSSVLTVQFSLCGGRGMSLQTPDVAPSAVELALVIRCLCAAAA